MIGLIDRNTKKASLQRRSSDVEENDLQEEDNEKLHRNGNLAGNLFRVILILAFLAWLTTFTAPNVSYVADQKQSSIKFLKTADSFVTATESSIPVHGAALPATQSTTAYSVQCIDHLPQPDLRLHMVEPPAGAVTLVCCNSTKGVLNIEVHPTWAPKGAERFLYMVKNNFFSTKVGLFRALKGFLVQFGLAGDPEVHKFYHQLGNLPDDPSWLPLGPSGRVVNGVERFRKGYLAYAGAGKNSRGTQLIMAFNNNRYLGGGNNKH